MNRKFEKSKFSMGHWEEEEWRSFRCYKRNYLSMGDEGLKATETTGRRSLMTDVKFRDFALSLDEYIDHLFMTIIC